MGCHLAARAQTYLCPFPTMGFGGAAPAATDPRLCPGQLNSGAKTIFQHPPETRFFPVSRRQIATKTARAPRILAQRPKHLGFGLFSARGTCCVCSQNFLAEPGAWEKPCSKPAGPKKPDPRAVWAWSGSAKPSFKRPRIHCETAVNCR